MIGMSGNELIKSPVEVTKNLKRVLLVFVASTLVFAAIAAAQLVATSCTAVGPKCSGVPGVAGVLSVSGWLLLGVYLRRVQLAAAAFGAWTGFVVAFITWYAIKPIVSEPTLATVSFDPLGARQSFILWPIVGSISAFAFSRIRPARLPLAILLSLAMCFAAAVWAALDRPAPAGMF